ncbi:MAG: carboxylating nicotinate-nucleotide diphosphorylase [Planctomycetota bacterium]|jgi:nicotinate-nucleotide pyrophosphorylase (carboxylating)|nr:carboxylating nicotinate-nucleotide diphosphorylase [Planctomycetota bacterium]
MGLAKELVQRHVAEALAEDLGSAGDVTSLAVVPEASAGVGVIVAKEAGLLCGVDIATETFRELDPTCEFTEATRDGDDLVVGTTVLGVRGHARALLAGERTALNFLQRLSGIATRARALANAVAGTGCVVMETRKTTPGLRALEKYAVAVGGGRNHRFGLFDAVLLKENHFALAGNGTDPAGYRVTVEQAVAGSPVAGPCIAEVRDMAEAEAALEGGAGVLLLDNFSVAELHEAVPLLRKLAGGVVELEASGGIGLDNAAQYAATGVDRISVGALTHSVPSIDLSMLITGVDA